MKEKTKNSIKFTTLAGLFIALGIVLPIAFHALPDGGKIFLPMFLPVVIGALFLPWQYALAVGVITPMLSWLITGMPPMAPLPMNIMLAMQLGVTSLLIAVFKSMKWFNEKRLMIIIALIPSLLIGFGISGSVLKAAVELFGVKGPGMWAYISGAVITGLPGIAVLTVLVPAIYLIIRKRTQLS
ncbi:MAG: ECF transporter S component [Clostridia bacterium]|nr:ECF transporter S component [Clostridia bacterium]